MNRLTSALLRTVTGASCLLSPLAAAALVPATAQVEGLLTASGGGAAADGNYKVTFSIYKDETGGNPVWSENDVVIAVKGGVFAYSLGAKSALTQQALTDLGGKGWLGIKIEADPELARKPLASVIYALRAGAAEALDCTGCVKAAHIDGAVLGAYAKTADLAKVAVTGDFADLKGGPDLSAYVKGSSLHKVASSGAFADLTGGPDLTAYAKLAGLADVAKTGNYADLKGAPVLAKIATTGEYVDLKNAPVAVKVGASCGTGLVIKGLKADGSYECVAAMDPKAFPPDAIDEISNNLIHNQFVDSTSGKPNVDIKDGFLFGVADSLLYPDIGISQKLNVSVHITNTNIQHITVSVFDPAGVEHLLHEGDKKGTGTLLKASYPDPVKQVSGDLTSWVGKNPKGEWTLKVVDSGSAAPGNTGLDGKVVAWSVDVQTLSNQKIAVKGKLIVGSSIQIGKDDSTCTAANQGSIRWTGAAFQACIGTGWTGLQGPDGQTKTAAAASCKALKASHPNSPDGPYWIDTNGGPLDDAYQAICNMSRDGGGWTMGVKHWYQAGVNGNAGAVGSIGDALTLKGNGYKLSDAQIKEIIGTDNNFDVMLDQAGYNASYSGGNYEYVLIRNYTAVWTFAANVAASSTKTIIESRRISDNALAWKGNYNCGNVGGWGINCLDVTEGPNPAGGSGCNFAMGSSSGGWHHIYMSETNSDTYLYQCNGAQHSSGHNMNHRYWFR